MTHSLVLIDRGQEHVHRWKPSCSCEKWTGAQRRRKREAIKQYRSHRSYFAASKPNGTWRRPTPESDLPECLRVSA